MQPVNAAKEMPGHTCALEKILHTLGNLFAPESHSSLFKKKSYLTLERKAKISGKI